MSVPGQDTSQTPSASARSTGLTCPGSFAWTESGPAPAYERIVSQLAHWSRRERSRRQARLDRAAEELDLHFGLPDPVRSAAPHPDTDDSPARLDLFPVALTDAVWASLAQGILQRARMLDAYLRDIYGEQRVLKERVLPVDLVLGDPGFSRPAAALPPRAEPHVQIGALDLVPGSDDSEWRVAAHHCSQPFGLAYAIQNRRMMAQALPELFQGIEVEPVSPFLARAGETLKSLAGRPDPFVVLLARSATPESFFEESFLARQMGFPLVRPSDLLVRDARVYLKTVAGLEPVDVIYRRLSAASSDPITYGFSGQEGVPGLVHCIRKGTVKIANALGCSVADNRSLLRYADQLVPYYLNEAPLLRSLKTYWCGDPDQAEHVMRFQGDVQLTLTQSAENLRTQEPDFLAPETAQDLQNLMTRRPGFLAAQQRPGTRGYPGFQDNGSLRETPVRLRVFFALGEAPEVLPGGLAWWSHEDQREQQGPVRVNGVKDCWVLARPHPDRRRPVKSDHAENQPHAAIGSRVAESLYWLGRYIERAESTARMLGILETLQGDQLGPEVRETLWPLWKGVVAATGHHLPKKEANRASSLPRLTRQLLVDPDEPASVRASVDQAFLNARNLREFLPPEVFVAVHDLSEHMHQLAGRRRLAGPAVQQLCQEVVEAGARINGIAARTMLHDDGWRFFVCGQLLERIIATVTVTEHALTLALRRRESRQYSETDLTALLRMLASLDAYRRTYRSRAFIGRVLTLLWQHPEAPNALLHGLLQIRTRLGEVEAGERLPEVLEATDRLVGLIRDLRLGEIVPDSIQALDATEAHKAGHRTANDLERLAGELRERLEGLHDVLEDTFFTHQGLHLQGGQMTFGID
ncbi:MAG: circularly permuted type 2 ATP-grasp protein [Opitutales bacterium]